MNKVKEAIECYQAALKIEPNFPEALNNLGLAFLFHNDSVEAIKYLDAALKIQPTKFQAL